MEIKHDTYEYEVVINGVECTYCETLEHRDMIHAIGDLDICESCYQGCIE